MSDRREFLKHCGILGGLFLVSQQEVVNSLSQFSRFNLKLDLNNLNLFFTGNLKGNLSELGQIKDTSSLLFDAGNFISSSSEIENQIKKMNFLGYQVAALGKNELALGEEKLIQLVQKSEFALVNSHINFENKILSKLVKPFQIIDLVEKKVGVLSISSGFKSSRDLKKINELANTLKNKQNCGIVVCLIANNIQKKTAHSLLRKSENVDLFWTPEIPNTKGGNFISRNALAQEVTLIYGTKSKREIGYYQADLSNDYYLPKQIIHEIKTKQFIG
jgi:hypothetical protein